MGGPDLGLGLLHVVLDEAVGDQGTVLNILDEDVGGEGIAVPWLADGTWVDEVGSARPEVEGVVGAGRRAIGRWSDRLYVCMSEEADPNVRVLCFQNNEVLPGSGRVQDILIRVAH